MRRSMPAALLALVAPLQASFHPYVHDDSYCVDLPADGIASIIARHPHAMRLAQEVGVQANTVSCESMHSQGLCAHAAITSACPRTCGACSADGLVPRRTVAGPLFVKPPAAPPLPPLPPLPSAPPMSPMMPPWEVVLNRTLGKARDAFDKQLGDLSKWAHEINITHLEETLKGQELEKLINATIAKLSHGGEDEDEEEEEEEEDDDEEEEEEAEEGGDALVGADDDRRAAAAPVMLAALPDASDAHTETATPGAAPGSLSMGASKAIGALSGATMAVTLLAVGKHVAAARVPRAPRAPVDDEPMSAYVEYRSTQAA